MADPSTSPTRRRVGWLLAAALVAAGLAALWLARISLAEAAAKRWCRSQAMSCSFKVETLRLGEVEVSGLAVSGTSRQRVLAAERVSARLAWPGLLRPAVTALTVDAPVVSVGLDADGFDLDGLDQLFRSPRRQAAAPELPAMRVNDGRVSVRTPAGDLDGRFEARVDEEGAASLTVAVDPAELRDGDDMISLSAGTAHLAYEGGDLSGDIRLSVDAFRFDEATGQALVLDAALDEEGGDRLDWQAEVRALTTGDGATLQDLTATGSIGLARGPGAFALPQAVSISDITASIETAKLAARGYRADAMTVDVTAKRTDSQRYAVTLDGAATAPQGALVSAARASLSFAGQVDTAQARLSGTGSFLVSNAAVSGPLVARQLQTVEAALPASAHARGFRIASEKALRDITTGGQFRLDAASDDDWNLAFTESVAVRSASGLNAVLSAPKAAAPVTVSPGRVRLQGVLSLSGGGFPRVEADISEAVIAGDTLAVRTGGLTVHPWTEAALTLSARLNQADISRDTTQLRIGAIGRLGVDGAVFGMGLHQASLFGGIDAVRDNTGWRVQTAGRDCLGLEIGSAELGGAVTLQPQTLQLCPQQGRITRQTQTALAGRVNLGDITVPFTGRAVRGTLALHNAHVDWTAGRALDLAFTADTLGLPSEIGERTLDIAASAPRLDLSFGPQTRMSATLNQTRLDGDMVPANVMIETMRLDGRLAQGRFAATGTADRVHITDTDPDPRYRPLVANLDAVFDGADLTMSGPVSLQQPDIRIGDAVLDLDLLKLDGTAKVTSIDLVFAPRSLQPKTLSDRVRGLFSNGRGAVSAAADFTIRQGVVTGTGDVSITDFGFDSQRLGSADGINGALHFDDIIALTTAPGQRVTIASFDPGLPLVSGELVFQLVGGTTVELEKAHWPLAGGTLSLITPASWTVGGGREIYRIRATNIELAELVDALALPDIVADGTVSGEFPIEFADGNTYIRDAHLAADAAGGTLSYTGAITEPASESDERVRAAFQALRDFRFKVLEVGLDGNLIDDIVVSLRLLGRNPEVYGGADFDFRITVDSKLAQLIQSGRRAATTRWIADAVVAEPDIDADAETDDPFN